MGSHNKKKNFNISYLNSICIFNSSNSSLSIWFEANKSIFKWVSFHMKFTQNQEIL